MSIIFVVYIYISVKIWVVQRSWFWCEIYWTKVDLYKLQSFRLLAKSLKDLQLSSYLLDEAHFWASGTNSTQVVESNRYCILEREKERERCSGGEESRHSLVYRICTSWTSLTLRVSRWWSRLCPWWGTAGLPQAALCTEACWQTLSCCGRLPWCPYLRGTGRTRGVSK